MLIEWIRYWDIIKPILQMFITASIRITVLWLSRAFFQNKILRWLCLTVKQKRRNTFAKYHVSHPYITYYCTHDFSSVPIDVASPISMSTHFCPGITEGYQAGERPARCSSLGGRRGARLIVCDIAASVIGMTPATVLQQQQQQQRQQWWIDDNNDAGGGRRYSRQTNDRWRYCLRQST